MSVQRKYDSFSCESKKCMFWLLLSFSLLYRPAIHAENLVDISYYFDSRGYNTTTFFMLNNDLGAGFSFLAFTDFHSEQKNESDRYDGSRTFSEVRLSNNKIAEWFNIDGLGLQVEYNDSTPGNNNNALRFGVTYKNFINKNDWLLFRAFPIDSRNEGQISLIYFFKFTDNFNLSGIADYNFIAHSQNQWIFEPQLNYKLYSKLWLLLEYRYNGFEDDNPNVDGSGTALGLRYEF